MTARARSRLVRVILACERATHRSHNRKPRRLSQPGVHSPSDREYLFADLTALPDEDPAAGEDYVSSGGECPVLASRTAGAAALEQQGF